MGVALLLALWAAVNVCCAQHCHHDGTDLMQFDPYEPAANEEYPQLGCVSATASWKELQARFAVDSTPAQATGSCEAWARSFPEPFHPSQLLRNRPVLPWPSSSIPGGVGKALCRLGRNVTYQEFLALPTAAPRKDAHWLRHYRVLRGRLYVNGSLSHPEHLEGYEELLLMAVFLYHVPDMDLWLSHGDVPIAQGPLIQYAMDLRADVSGCSMPYFAAWRDSALTLQQSMAWAACIAHRYPRPSRHRKAVWRGSTTDTTIHDVKLSNAVSLARVRLHMLGQVHSDVLDVKVTGVVQSSSGGPELGTLLNVHANGLPFEDFQSYASVLDIDGNSFSRRMHQLVQMGGPILKQASPFPSYFEHMFAPGVMPIHRFANNLTDVAAEAKLLLDAISHEIQTHEWDEAINNMHAVAAITLNRWSMIESVAYSLSQLASHNSWTPTDADGLTAVPWTKCCVGGGVLPQQLIKAMHAAEKIEGPLQAAVYSATDNDSAVKMLERHMAAMNGASPQHDASKCTGHETHTWSGHSTNLLHNKGHRHMYLVVAAAVGSAMATSLAGFVWLLRRVHLSKPSKAHSTHNHMCRHVQSHHNDIRDQEQLLIAHKAQFEQTKPSSHSPT